MKKIIKRIVCLGFTLVLCCCTLWACVGSKYGATLINDIKQHMREDFLSENRTYNVRYRNPNYNEETDSWNEQILVETEGPKTREFIVCNEEEYLKIFKDMSSIDINFEKQMLVVCMFTKSNARPLVLTEMKVNGNELFVKFKDERRSIHIKDESEPGQGCIAIVMDKYNISSVRFVYEK